MFLFIERRVCKVNIPLIHFFLGQSNGFAETLEVHDLPLPQEADDVGNVGIITHAQDVIIGDPGFLFCRVCVRTTFLMR